MPCTVLGMAKEFQHKPRAQFTGSLNWLCPKCGYINCCRVDRTAWRVRCKAKKCRKWYAVGFVFHSLAHLRGSGRRTVPPPDIAFPVAELKKWKLGGPVHRHEEEGRS